MKAFIKYTTGKKIVGPREQKIQFEFSRKNDNSSMKKGDRFIYLDYSLQTAGVLSIVVNDCKNLIILEQHLGNV